MKIAILGAGISGLAAAFFLQKEDPTLQLTVFESSDTVGGAMESSVESGFFFEHGPRTFSTSRAPELLELIRDAGLQSSLLFSYAKTRYLLHDKKVKAVPSSLWRLLLSPFGKGVVHGMLKDLRHPKGIKEDESIYSFVKRHANEDVAKTLVEPLVLGIYGGDYKKLSVSACFPEWKECEYKYGSFLKGMFKSKTQSNLPPLFTLSSGIQTLPEKLAELFQGDLRLNTPVTSIAESEREVMVNGELFDHVITALPSSVMKVLAPKKYMPFFDSFESLTLTAVNAVIKEHYVPSEGFGYLVPSSENDNVLGVVFDSKVFPLEGDGGHARVTVMMRGDKNTDERAISALQRHLGCAEAPVYIQSHVYKNYLPQLPVGHLSRVDRLQSDHLSFIGNYIHGGSVNRCIKEAKKAAKKLTAGTRERRLEHAL